jgi:NitT/TauT family transport system substrate-binding protein
VAHGKTMIAGVCLMLPAAAVMVWLPRLDVPLWDKGNSQSLRVGTNVWPGYEPLYCARSLGYYDDHVVRLVECSSASQVMRAFSNNTIEVAALTLDEVLLLVEAGYDIRVILITDISDGGDVILAKRQVAGLADLRGRAVGVENTALGAFVLTRALQSVGMSVSDVQLVPVPVNEHEVAFDEGKIDAVVTFEPVRTRLVAKGAVQLFDSTKMPGEIVDVLVVRSGTIETFHDKLTVLLRGWFSALKHLQEQPEDASRHMAERMQLAPSQVLASLQRLRFPDVRENTELMTGAPSKLAITAEQLAEVMFDQKLMQTKIDISPLFSARRLMSINGD